MPVTSKGKQVAPALDISGVNLTNEMQQQYYKFGDAGSPELTNFGTVQTGRAISALPVNMTRPEVTAPSTTGPSVR